MKEFHCILQVKGVGVGKSRSPHQITRGGGAENRNSCKIRG
jgi:hypothetical protein